MGECDVAKVKFKITTGLIDPNLESNYVAGPMALIDDRKTVAQFDDQTNGNQIVLLGEKFKYDGDSLVGGTVKEVQFRLPDGEVFATAVKFDLSAVEINDLLLGATGGNGFFPQFLKEDDTIIGRGAGNGEIMQGEEGNDILKGKGGNDTLVGNVGNDILSGGVGNDVFQFFSGNDGKDVITDFNIGDDINFDTIFVRNTAFSFGQTTDGDLKVKFADGGQVILKGVDFDDRNDVTFDAIL